MIDEATMNEVDAKIINFVSTALGQDKFSGLSEMLRAIAETVDAYGCVLWQVTPGSKLDATPPRGSLFPVAQWFRAGQMAFYDLPLNSATGYAALTAKPINVPNVYEEPLNVLDSFEDTLTIKTMCSVPIVFMDGSKGSVNVYKNLPTPFDEDDVRTVQQLASLIPSLYETIRDKVSFKLVSTIDQIITKADLKSREVPLTPDKFKHVFHSICQQVASIFQSIEVSIFMSAKLEEPDQYELMGTTWRGRFKKTIYKASDREGVTGWVLSRGKSIRIFDFAHFERDQKAIRRQYPNLVWRDSLEIKTTVRQLFQLSNDVGLPPLSFVAVPIVARDDVLGVLRCAIRKNSPYYFHERDVELLTLVAAQVGRFSSNWLDRRRTRQEAESWRTLVRSVSRLNQFVQSELRRETPDELRIIDEALRLTSTAIPGAEIMDVRLFDESSNDLYFARTHGPAWDQGSPSEIENRKSRRFGLSEDRASAGAHAFNTGRLYVIRDPAADPYYSQTFPGIKRMIIAPISVERERFGVLDIRTTTDSEFPRHAEAIADLLGQQLGLYHYLCNTIGKLRKAETELKENVAGIIRLQKQQAQTFEDLEHQLRSPIIQAYGRIQYVLAEELTEEKLRYQLLAIRGLCGKAKRVATSTGLFADLARQEAIQSNRKTLEYEYLIRALIQAAADQELFVDPARRITFHVDRGAPEVLRNVNVRVDPDLLEQAISNLLDNAAKYSFPHTRIDLRWGLTRGDRFHITVLNKGLPIRHQDVHLCRERGWRGSMASATTGEGSGIGLWIVENIMNAHDGELVIIPTSSMSVTEIKLIFPAVKR